jgi:biotin synthase
MQFLNNKLDKNKLIELLRSRGYEQQLLFQSAFEIKKQYFDNVVHPRGVLEISNHCQLNCLYCGMRIDNKALSRYRMKWREILQSALLMEGLGVKSIMLQSGDDYLFPINELVEIIRVIRKETNLQVILCLGERRKSDLEKMLMAGASSYILKLETINPLLFKQLRPETSFERRLELLMYMKSLGYKTSSGFIVGLPGQSIDELVEGLMILKEIQVDNASVSPFIPNDGSPLKNNPFGDLELSLNMVAVMRILLRNINIPSVSAFSVLSDEGQVRGFNAGSNVITINFSPVENLENYIIYTSKRKIVSIENAKEIIIKSGLTSDIITKKLTKIKDGCFQKHHTVNF